MTNKEDIKMYSFNDIKSLHEKVMTLEMDKINLVVQVHELKQSLRKFQDTAILESEHEFVPVGY